VSNWPTPPAGVRALPSSQVDSSALPSGLSTAGVDSGWRPHGRALRSGGGCTHAPLELREQTPRLVRIALVEVTTSSGPCTMDLRFPIWPCSSTPRWA
ncbi:MAG: hypothetical protein ACRDTJ_19500, partial [Pseudonocardiaceae bacterium]